MIDVSSQLPDQDESLALIITYPGVLDVLATLHNHGPHQYLPLCAYAPRRAHATTASALRKLATLGLVQRLGGGSWDHPGQAGLYELTGRGHQLAQLFDQLSDLITRHHTAS
jgi:DNA-binding HxlR family transcriptional regulator